MLLTCSVAGAIPAAAAYNDLPDGDECLWLAAAFIAHWAIAGMMMWGLLAAIVPAWCFHELLHGGKSALVVLGIAFGTQLLVSTVAMLVMEGGPEWQRVAVASGIGFGVLAGGALVRARFRRIG